MPLDLIADGGADEVGAVGVEPLLDQKIDVTQVDVAEVDRDLLGVGRLAAELVDVVGHFTILSPSIWMVIGAAAPGFKRRDVEFQARVLTPLRCASEAKSHDVMRLVQIPRYRAELSVGRACRGGP